MGNTLRVEVWGDFACFSRPEFKTERVSYDIITPSAAEGLLNAIYKHPGMRHVIDRIYLLSPIKTMNIKKMERKDKAPKEDISKAMKSGDLTDLFDASKNTPRASLVLKDVHYVIESHIIMTDQAAEGDNLTKFYEITRRRLQKGQDWQHPYLGIREFAGYVREWPSEVVPTIPKTCDLGFMPKYITFAQDGEVIPHFFRAKMENGVLDCHNVEVF